MATGVGARQVVQLPSASPYAIAVGHKSSEGRILAVSRPGNSATHGPSVQGIHGIPGSPPRTSFAKIREPLEVPNLLALQTESFDWLVGNAAWQARVALDDPSY